MNGKIKLIKFPEVWISDNWKKYFDIFLLEIDGKCSVLSELISLSKRSDKDFKLLLSTIKIQLESETLLRNRKRLQRGLYKEQKNILEFKSSGGSSRLFGFVDDDDNRIIICTNTYWKTTGKKRRQNDAFEKAERMRKIYLSSSVNGEGRWIKK